MAPHTCRYHLHAICGGGRLFHNVSRPQKQKLLPQCKIKYGAINLGHEIVPIH